MEQVFSYIISLGASVMMPIIFTVIGLYFVTDMAPDFTLAANQVYAATGDNAAHIPDGFSGGALDFASSLFGWVYLSRCEAFIRRYGCSRSHHVSHDGYQPSAHREGRKKVKR